MVEGYSCLPGASTGTAGCEASVHEILNLANTRSLHENTPANERVEQPFIKVSPKLVDKIKSLCQVTLGWGEHHWQLLRGNACNGSDLTTAGG
jgi:hypothetical protein